MKHGEKADASIPNRGTGRQGGTLELFACCLFGACARKKSGRVKTGMRNTNPKQQKTKKKAPEFSLNRFSFCGCGCGCICAACCGAKVSMCVCERVHAFKTEGKEERKKLQTQEGNEEGKGASSAFTCSYSPTNATKVSNRRLKRVGVVVPDW